MYARYGSGARDILRLPFDEAMELCDVARQKSAEDKLFERWINGVQMVMGYEEFKKQVLQGKDHISTNRGKKKLTEEETYEKVSKILGKDKAHGDI